MAIEVYELTTADYDAWHPLWQGYLEFYKTVIPEETTRETWKRLTDPAEPMFALGAFSENRLIGIAHVVYHRSCWTIGDYCYMQDLFTAPKFRGQGVGTALIKAVYARAEADGTSRVYWLTHETNRTAQKLYEKIATRSGFVQFRKILSL